MTWLIVFWLGICPVCKTENTMRNETRGTEQQINYSSQNLMACKKCNNAFWAKPDKIYQVRIGSIPVITDTTGRYDFLKVVKDTTLIERPKVDSGKK